MSYCVGWKKNDVWLPWDQLEPPSPWEQILCYSFTLCSNNNLAVGYCSSNAADLYLRAAQFEFLSGHWQRLFGTIVTLLETVLEWVGSLELGQTAYHSCYQ
jgi:hypothetical protein